MNYADIKLGTWYPQGGMRAVVDGMVAVAEQQGVQFETNKEVTSFNYHSNKITEVVTKDEAFKADVVVGGADYHHIETNILEEQYRNYSDKYWDSRMLAPSSLLFYLGFNKKIENLNHHTLFFDEPFGPHAEAIYTTKEWPENRCFM